MLRGLIPAGLQGRRMGAVGVVHHVRRHVQAGQWKVHQSGELVPPLPHLPKALQVEDEYIWQRPQAHLHHALLELLAVGALPRIVWCKLRWEEGEKKCIELYRTWLCSFICVHLCPKLIEFCYSDYN